LTLKLRFGAGVGNSMQKKPDRDKSDKDYALSLGFICLY